MTKLVDLWDSGIDGKLVIIIWDIAIACWICVLLNHLLPYFGVWTYAVGLLIILIDCIICKYI
jgi:hypothetical protein